MHGRGAILGAVELTLASAFLAGWEGPAPADRRSLDDGLRAALTRARQAWPSIAVDDTGFAGFLADRVAVDEDPVEALARLQVEALYLTCGCARGQPDALRVFDGELLAKAPAYLARMSPTRALIDEVQQLARERLLVGVGGAPPRIAQYTGRGSLEGFVRIAVVRLATDLFARERPRDAGVADDAADPAALLGPGHDAERRFLQGRYAGDFAAAFREALAGLPARDRNLLRFHYLERMTPARIGTMHGVHRTTVMRWLDAAGEALLAATRANLIARLGLSAAECDSLIELVKSRLDITLDALLRPAAGASAADDAEG